MQHYNFCFSLSPTRSEDKIPCLSISQNAAISRNHISHWTMLQIVAFEM